MTNANPSPIEPLPAPSPYAGTEDDARRMFTSARFVRFASTAEDGRPITRCFNAVLLDGALCFHGGDHGEKVDIVGRRAVAVVEDVVAQVPSHWVHPTSACPASTYYESAFAEGVITRIDDLAHKARVLTAIMERFQPEGGYAPIVPEDKRYAGVLRELLVCAMVPERLIAKRKLGQKRSSKEILGVLEGLWGRGGAGDLAAIRKVHRAHPSGLTPGFLRGPADTVFCVAPDVADADAVATLLEGAYWMEGVAREEATAAHLGSPAWVVARDAQGRVVASARAISDHGRFAWVMDVIVAPAMRGRGVGRALVALLLDHPSVRGLRKVGLATRDAQTFYETLGFVGETRPPPTMVRLRAG